MTPRPVYITDGSRTPFIRARGRPGPFTPVDLAVECGRPLLLRQPFAPDAFDQVILGCVNVLADEMNPARVAALRLGMGDAMPAFTVQINCGSGMQSIDTAYQYIREGHSDLILAGGAEALSQAPLIFRKSAVEWYARMFGARDLWSRLKAVAGFRPSFLKPVIGLERGLTDPVVELNMGQTAEILAHLFHISRHDADQYAVESQQRLARAQKDKCFDGELEPALSRDGKVYDHDDGVRPDTTVETLAKLRPAFEPPWGKVTAGNSSQITDGASWVILASEKAVKQHGLTPRAAIVGQRVVGARSLDHGARPGAVRDRDPAPPRARARRHRAVGAQRSLRGAGARLSRRLAGRKILPRDSGPRRRRRRDPARQAQRRRRRHRPRPSRRARAATASCSTS